LRPSRFRAPVVASLALIGALVGLTDSLERFLAARYQQRVEALKSSWQQHKAPGDEPLNNSFKLGYKAAEKDTASADHRFMLAGLHAWREKRLRHRPDQAAAETEKIIENIKAALARRPTWFEPWISLAVVKFQAGEIDYELQIALEKAMQTGRYETSVHHGIAFAGLRAWDSLEPELQGQITETLRIALDNGNVRNFVVKQIVMTGRFTPFGEQLASDPVLRRLVDKYQKEKEASL